MASVLTVDIHLEVTMLNLVRMLARNTGQGGGSYSGRGVSCHQVISAELQHCTCLGRRLRPSKDSTSSVAVTPEHQTQAQLLLKVPSLQQSTEPSRWSTQEPPPRNTAGPDASTAPRSRSRWSTRVREVGSREGERRERLRERNRERQMTNLSQV